MEITTGVGGATIRSTRTRLSTLLVAFALVAGSLLLVQQGAEAAPASSAAAVVALPGVDAAQIGGDFGDFFRSIVCPILLAVINAFDDGPFGGFVSQILNSFLVAFGCAPSG